MLINPFKTWWKARKYFKRPKIKLFFGKMYKKKHHTEDSTILKKNGELLYKKGEPYYTDVGFFYFMSKDYIKWGKKWWNKWITIDSRDVCFTDKWNEPRYDHPPFFSVIIGTNIYKAWQFAIVLKEPVSHWVHTDVYWELMLNYVYYNTPIEVIISYLKNNIHQIYSKGNVEEIPYYSEEMFTKKFNKLYHG